MKTYHYHPITGELIGESTADESPLEPGVFLIPAHATDQSPPTAQANKMAVYKDGAWSRVSDFRGTEAWKTDTGEKITVSELGTLNSLGLTDQPYPEYPATWNGSAWAADIDSMKKIRLDALDSSAASAYISGFTSAASGSEMFYDSDEKTQQLLSNIYQRTKETDWETKERYPGICPAGQAPIRARPNAESPDEAKTIQKLNAAQVKTLIDDLDSAFYAIKVKLWTKQAQVASATTVEELNAIVW